MNGRLEHELAINKNIKSILADMPECVTDFYMSIQAVRSPNTCINYIRKIKHFLSFVDTEDISSIDADDVERYMESIKYITNGSEVRKASTAYFKLVCNALNQFFKYLCRERKIDRNPMDYVNRPIRKDNVKRIFLSMDDLSRILEAAQKEKIPAEWRIRDYTILYLFMVTGMRKTALSEINLDDFDLENCTLTIVDKRDKEQRYELNEDAINIVKNWILARNEILQKVGVKEDALFISQKRFKRIDPKSIYEIVLKYYEKGIGRAISPHKLRAAFTSLYYAETKDIVATKNAVGHSDIQTTSIYITEENNSRKEASDFMSNNVLKK